jgi:hypothetical protein
VSICHIGRYLPTGAAEVLVTAHAFTGVVAPHFPLVR